MMKKHSLDTYQTFTMLYCSHNKHRISNTGAIKAINLGKQILGEEAEIITAPHVAIHCGIDTWRVVDCDKPLCSSHYDLGVGVECQVIK